MEKKAEKQIEITLTPDEGGTGASENELPLLVPDAVTGGVCSADPGPKAETGRTPGLPDPKTEAGGPPGLPAKGYGKLVLTVALLIGLFMIALPIKQSVIWYCSAPRPPASQAAPLFFPAILGAWFGDADSAYALETVPSMATPSKQYGESMALRNSSIKMLERFWQGPGDPQKALSRLGGSVALSSYGDTAETVRQFRPVMKTGASPMLYLYNAILLANNGDLTGAMKSNDEGLRLSNAGQELLFSSDKSMFYFLKAKLYQTMGDPEQALACLNSPGCLQTVKEHPNMSDFALFAKASAYLQLGQPDKAISLVSSRSDNVHSIFICGIAYLMKDNFAKALSEAKLINPTDGNKREILLSRICCKQGKLDEALLSAVRAEKQSANLIALEQRVFVLNKLGRYKEALAVSENFGDHLGLQLESEELLFRFLPELHAGRAEAYLKIGNFNNALQEAQQALKISRTCLSALHVAMQASLGLGDPRNAAGYERIIKELPVLPTYR